MGLRLVLVGLVAGLGMTLPTGEQVGDWGESAKAWVASQLAAMDARMPVDERAFVYVSEPPPIEAVATTEVAATETAKTRDEQVEAAEDMPALDLDVPSEPVALDDADMPPSPVAAVPEIGLSSEAEPTAPPVEEWLPQDVSFTTAQNDVLESFQAETRAALRETLDFASPEETVVMLEALEPGDDVEVAFEPIELGDDLYAGVAYALNHQAEGLDLPPAIAAKSAVDSAPHAETRLSHAVKLTREAVHAWANLLHGAAVVTINP